MTEIRLFINTLDNVTTTLVSDHMLNLLEELEGTLPQDKDNLLETIDRYFHLSEEERLVYRIGRRRGIYRSLDDLGDQAAYRELKEILDRQRLQEPADLDGYLTRLMSRYI